MLKTRSDVIYLGDNGSAYCGEHLGYTAKVTGRDLSGQRLMTVTPEMVAEAGFEVKCEECGKPASRLHIV